MLSGLDTYVVILQAADAVDGSGDKVHSYELPCVTQATDVEMVTLVLAWAEEQSREFILFDVEGPLVIAEPVIEEEQLDA